MKTIVATVTVHVPGPAFAPFKFSDAGVATEGKYDITEIPPGKPVDLDDKEADRLIALGIAEVYKAPVAMSVPAPAESAPPEPALTKSK